MTEEETEKEEIIKPKSKKEKLAKWLAGIFLLTGGIVLFIIAWQTDISLKYPLIIGVVLVIVALLIFFSFSIYRKFEKLRKKEKSEDKIPEPMSEEEIKERIKNVLTNEEYRDHIKFYKPSLTFEIGKNLIYYFIVTPLYSKRDAHIIINANFPRIMPSVFYDVKVTEYQIRKAINSKSSNPLPEPDIEKREVWSPLTQSFITETKKTQKKKKTSTEEKKEDIT